MDQRVCDDEQYLEDTAVIGVTPAIYNDTISVSKSSPIMDDDFKAALSQAFINIGDTEEGKAVISIYSHQGYQPRRPLTMIPSAPPRK